MWVLILSLLSLLLFQAPESGTLTLVVRDRAGTPLPGITVALFYDADDGRVAQGERTTDAGGEIVYRDLRWGLYIVQFRGLTPAGQALLPPERQNLGLLEDGSGAANGFGVRFAEDERTELFIVAQVPGETAAVPMFDSAPSRDVVPTPIDPLLATLASSPEAAVLASTPSTQVARQGVLAVLGLFLAALGGTLVLGWLRSRAADQRYRQTAEEVHE